MTKNVSPPNGGRPLFSPRPELGVSHGHSMTPLLTMHEEIQPPFDPARAVYEAERCLECGQTGVPAPCTVACPAGIDVPGFIRNIRLGRLSEAQDIVFAENPLAGTCARVCPTPVLCEGACVLNHIGLRPVAVGRLQRMAADWSEPSRGAPPQRSSPRIAQVAVVGAGPSGLACAQALSAQGVTVTVYDAAPSAGGLVCTAIAPYRQPDGSLAAEIQRLEASGGVRFEFNRPMTTREDFRRLEDRHAAIFLGVGLGPDKAITIPGHHLAGVWAALPFIERAKTGDWTPRAEHLIVIGAGNTAIDVAREGIRLGIPEVTILYRRTPDKMRAYPYEVREAVQEGVRFQWQVEVQEILGTWRVTGVRCRRTGAGGDALLELSADFVVSAIGQQPRSDLSQLIDGLAWNGSRLVVDPASGQTGNPRYYAAGDLIGGTTVVEAVRGAKVAARAIVQSVRRNAG